MRKLVDENLEIDGRPIGRELDPSKNFLDAGVGSVDFVVFMRAVVQEFGIEDMTADDCDGLQTLTDLIEYLDSKAA